VTGVPARLTAWVCACGQTLSIKGHEARCIACAREYAVDGPTVIRSTADIIIGGEESNR
jgi:hypothetical protein